VYNGYPVNAQQKCLADLRRHFKSPQIRPWQQPSPRASLLELIDEAFTKHRHKLRIQVLTKLGQRASSYECNSIQQWIGRAGYEAGLYCDHYTRNSGGTS